MVSKESKGLEDLVVISVIGVHILVTLWMLVSFCSLIQVPGGLGRGGESSRECLSG